MAQVEERRDEQATNRLQVPDSETPDKTSAAASLEPPASDTQAATTEPVPSDLLPLPEKIFTYIGRPWNSFEGRFRPIEQDMASGREDFTMFDIGSCNGYFCLQTANKFKQSLVIGLEGSVGIGNGTVGENGGSPNDILSTTAVKTHIQYTKQFELRNCHLSPEVWTYDSVCKMVNAGVVFDFVLLLSVIHHMDGYSLETNRYADQGYTHLEGTLDMTANLLRLGKNSYIELPDRPWIAHVYDVYKDAHTFLLAACRRAFGYEGSGQEWYLEGPIYENQWFGNRTVYRVRQPNAEPMSHEKVMLEFPTLLPWRDSTISTRPKPYIPTPAKPGEVEAAQRKLKIAIDEATLILDDSRRQHGRAPGIPTSSPAYK